MNITHAMRPEETITIEYSGTRNLFYFTAGNITIVLYQAHIETIYAESFGAMLHADEKTEA